jgi:hypothetical protein
MGGDGGMDDVFERTCARCSCGVTGVSRSGPGLVTACRGRGDSCGHECPATRVWIHPTLDELFCRSTARRDALAP